MATIFVDIETVPGQEPWIRDEVAASVKPPGTLKKAESIAAWERDDRPAAVEEAYSRTGLDGALGQVLCIGWAVDDEPPQAACAFNLELTSEAAILAAFFEAMRKVHLGTSGMRPVIVGFNHAAFDIPFIWKRSIVHGIQPPIWFPRNPKPWSESVFDCMTQWAGDRDRISLDRLCRVLGIEGKGDGPTGADVWPMAQAGKFQEIADYCKADVERTRAVYRRLTFA